MLRFHVIGDYAPGTIHTRWVASSHDIRPDVAGLIAGEWLAAKARLGDHLFDGPMCRLEGFEVGPAELRLTFSRTSYRIFLGTNLMHPEVAGRYGWAALANPMGVSSALITADNHLMMGRRNSTVAYHPERVHPFAGAMEPREPLDVFEEVRRELREELSFGPSDISSIRCAGLVEDVALRQPELIFIVQSSRSRPAVEGQVDKAEHRASWSIPFEPELAAGALGDGALLTPVAVATILLAGRARFGADWFDQHAPAYTHAEPLPGSAVQ